MKRFLKHVLSFFCKPEPKPIREGWDRHVWIYGPAGCGKSHHAKSFMWLFGCAVLNDEVEGRTAAAEVMAAGRMKVLFLSQDPPKLIGPRASDVEVWSFKDAFDLLQSVKAGAA